MTEEYTPSIPPRVRTIVYVTGLAFVFVGIVASETVEVIAPQLDATVNGLVNGIDKGLLFLTGALGVAYRPTRTYGS